jgi:hypothetical protein
LLFVRRSIAEGGAGANWSYLEISGNQDAARHVRLLAEVGASSLHV